MATFWRTLAVLGMIVGVITFLTSDTASGALLGVFCALINYFSWVLWTQDASDMHRAHQRTTARMRSELDEMNELDEL